MRKFIIGTACVTIIASVAVFFAARWSIPKDRVQLVLNNEQTGTDVQRVIVGGLSYFLLDDLEDALDIDYVMDGKKLRLFAMARIPDAVSHADDTAGTGDGDANADEDANAVEDAKDTEDTSAASEPPDMMANPDDSEPLNTLEPSPTPSPTPYKPYSANIGGYDMRDQIYDYSRVPDLGNALNAPPRKIVLETGYSKTVYYYIVRIADVNVPEVLSQVLADAGFTRTDSVGTELNFYESAGTEDEFVFTQGSMYVSFETEPEDEGWQIVIVRLATN